MAAGVGILSHLQRYLEPFGSGSENISLMQLHLLAALGCSGEANVLVAFSLQDRRANFMGPGGHWCLSALQEPGPNSFLQELLQGLSKS